MSSGSPRRERHFGSGQSGRRPQRRLPAWPLHWGRRALFRTPAHWILTTAFVLDGIIIITIIRWCYYLHLIDEGTEAWRMKIFSSSPCFPHHFSLRPLLPPAPFHFPPWTMLAGLAELRVVGTAYGHCLWALPRLGSLLTEAWGPDPMCPRGLAQTTQSCFPSQARNVRPSHPFSGQHLS